MANKEINDIQSFINDIQEDAQLYAKNIAKHMAMDIANEMTETARSAIEAFYSQYDPEDASIHNGQVYYYRNWNFRKSFKKYYKNRDPRYTGGVELLRNELPNVYHGRLSEPEFVFNRVYYFGAHGIASYQNCNPAVPLLRPAPIVRIANQYTYILKNLKSYEDKASKKAKKDKGYKYIF